MSNERSKCKKKTEFFDLINILRKFESAFRSELRDGLAPKRFMDHAIEVKKIRCYLIAECINFFLQRNKPAEETIEFLLNIRNIITVSRRMGAPLFFVKIKDKLIDIVDYRSLNKIIKRNNGPMLRTDEMFDRIRSAIVFSKMSLKTRLHQILIKSDDVEKLALNTKYGQFKNVFLPMGTVMLRRHSKH